MAGKLNELEKMCEEAAVAFKVTGLLVSGQTFEHATSPV
jgi:hypothetical protein